jgi:hypothetical protein
MTYSKAHATVAEIENAATAFAAQVADLPVQIRPNGFGVRAECTICRTSWTHNVMVSALREHIQRHRA